MGLVFYFLVFGFNNNGVIKVSNVKDLKYNFWV